MTAANSSTGPKRIGVDCCVLARTSKRRNNATVFSVPLFKFTLRLKSVLALVAVALLPSGMYGQTATATVKAGADPRAVAVNPATNKIYIANHDSGTVTVIDGASDRTTTVAAGLAPSSVAVNATANKIYVANHDDGTVTIIDGGTNRTKLVTAGIGPASVAVNPVTNKIYVANSGSRNLTVIDGLTDSTNSVVAGDGPASVAVNPVTNKIYVANHDSGTVTVVDGLTNSTATITAGSKPISIAVNPVTNMVYVANHDSGTLTIIDGASNRTTTVATGLGSLSVAVNPVTNKIYVANHDSGTVTIIYGPSDITNTVTTGGLPSWVVVNSMKNQIYVANEDSYTASVINGADDSLINVNTGAQPLSAAVNPVTNKVYVANSGSKNVTVIDGAVYSTNTITTGANPIRVALNPVTNKIYVVNNNYLNHYEGSVTVIDGATGETTNVPTGKGSWWVAVNPVTNKIYVCNTYSNSVTVIDGATNSTTTVPVGIGPVGIEVNPVTNKIYVADGGNPPKSNGDVAIIDGDTNRTTFVPAEFYPSAIAVNPVTNKIYVVSELSNRVMIIDGATNITTTVGTGSLPVSIALNSATNKIYVANWYDSTVSVIDGATNSTATVPTGQTPYQVAVNPVTNRAYVANSDDTITVIDGATNLSKNIGAGGGPYALAVNPATNKIYVGNENDTISVVDGVTNTLTTLPSGLGPSFVAVNLVTNKAYFVNTQGGNVTVVEESSAEPIPLVTSITPLAGDRTDSPNPSFTFSAKSGTVSTPDHVFFQLDTWQNPWGVASGSNRAFQGSLTSVQPGFHILYAYASNGQEATSTQQGSPLISPIQTYGFLAYGVPAPTGLHLRANGVTTAYGQPIVLTATVQSAKGQPLGTVVFSYGSNVLGSATLDSSGSATLTTKVLPVGGDRITATYLGNASYSSSTAALNETIVGADVPTLVSVSPRGGESQSQAFTAVYSDGYGLSDLGTVSILINTSGSTAHGCYAFYSLATNQFYLTDDGGNESLPPFAPGQSASVANSQCSLSGAGSSVATSGSTITVIFALSFTSNFNGSKYDYLGAVRRNGLGTGAVQEGYWTVLAPGLTMSRTTLSFTTYPNVPHSERVYVTNYNLQPISFNPTIEGSHDFKIIAQFGSCPVVSQYQTCGINIGYTPTSIGSGTATLYLNQTGEPSSEKSKVALSGFSVDGSVLVSTPQLTFLTPPGTSDYQRVYITNNLPYTLNLLPVLPSSEFSFVNDCSAIGSFQTCGIDINFTPSAVEQISGSMKLNFQNAPAGTEPKVLLEANSGGSPPVLVSTTRLRLETVMGTIVTSMPVFITNNTQKTISVTPVVTGNSEFTLSNTCSTLSPKQMCSMAVNFAGSADQIATGRIVLNLGNAPVHSPATIELEGFAPVAQMVTVNGQNQDFPVAITTNAGTFQTSVITVLNGTTHLLKLAPFINETFGEASFHIKQPCTSIPSQEVCQMTVLVTPPTVGFSSATLDVHPTNLQAGEGNPPMVLLQVSGTPVR